MAQMYTVPITDKRILSDDTFVIEIEAPEIARQARPGQFVMVSPMLNQINYDPITPRPYSFLALLGDIDNPWGFSLLIKKFGRGSEAIFTRQVGDRLQINGPLGNWLEMDNNLHYVLVAGGTGVAPATFSSQIMTHKEIKHTILYGGASKDAVFQKELERYRVHVEIATEDGSLGKKGFATDLLRENLKKKATAKHVFACGPWGMMKAATDISLENSTPCSCSLERYMACGFGVCLACIYKKTTDEINHTCCKEGPVVNGMEVDWNA